MAALHEASHGVALDRNNGVQHAIDLVRMLSPANGPTEIILVATNWKGLPNALRVQSSLLATGAPPALLLTPDANVCRAEGSYPCAYTGRFTWCHVEWCRIIRMRQYFLARFFQAGANVLQLDSDVVFFSNIYPVLQTLLRNASMVAQVDGTGFNSGMVYVKHHDASSDRVINWVLAEWNNRMLWASQEANRGVMHQP